MSPKKLPAEKQHKSVNNTIEEFSESAKDNASLSSEEDSDSGSSDTESDNHSSSSESGEEISTKLVEGQGFKQMNIPKSKTSDVRLSCLHEWDDEMLLSQFKRHLQEKQKLHEESNSQTEDGSYPTKIEVGGPLAKDFVPWWDEFTKAKCRSSHQKHSRMTFTEQNKDSDQYESWFSKASSSGTNWLAGSGTSSSASTSKQVSKVQDIEVPSIYDAKPQPKGRRALKRERRAEREKTLGKKWYEMKAPDVDEKMKNDMELIRMRGVLDPKRFYKHQDRKGLPKYFQMGTVVDEGTDFYSSRLSKKQRKQTLVEELMADANVRQYNKRKYGELQQKMRGKKKIRSKKT